MVKKSKKQILLDEIKVLEVLEHHAKESVDEIAKRCGFSRQKVWKIIKHLEENKIIWGYSAITDERAKNLKHFVLLVKRTLLPFDDSVRKEIIFEKLDEKIDCSVKMENIYFTHGDFDLIFTFYAPDLFSAKKFINICFSKYPAFVKDYLLFETLIPIRKQGLKNPQLKNLCANI